MSALGDDSRMTDDLVTWLGQQLDDDERVAREAIAATIAPDWAKTYPTLAESGTYRSGRWWACSAKWKGYQGPPQVVRAQIDESEDGDPTYSGPAPYVVTVDDADEAPIIEHIARHDPARVLAEVDAKRRILDEHPIAEYRDECRRCFDPDTAAGDYDFETFPCPTLRALALPHADRPGYRDEWKP